MDDSIRFPGPRTSALSEEVWRDVRTMVGDVRAMADTVREDRRKRAGRYSDPFVIPGQSEAADGETGSK